MNTKHGLNLVMLKQEAINAIALSLKHKSLRTKGMVLELLAAVCLVQGSHQLILKAFDNFKDVSPDLTNTSMTFFGVIVINKAFLLPYDRFAASAGALKHW